MADVDQKRNKQADEVKITINEEKKGNNSNESEPLIINEVLCFIQNHIKRTTKDKIVECVARSFSPEAVIRAKEMLANDKRLVKGKLKNRRNTNARLKHEQTADDLVEAMMYLDQIGIETNYVVKNIFVLPKCDPKDIDPYAMLQRVMLLEEKVAVHESLIMKNDALRKQTYAERVADTGTVRQQSMMESRRSSSVVPRDVTTSASRSRDHPGRGDVPVSNAFNALSGSVENVEDVIPKRVMTRQQQNQLMENGAERKGKQMSDSEVNDSQSRSLIKEKIDQHEAPWINVSKEKKGKRKAGTPRSDSKVKSAYKVHGSVKSGVVHGAPLPKRDFFISRVSKDTTDEQMLEYITGQGVISAEIQCVSNPNAAYCSYKLTVPVIEKDKVMVGDIWPYGVCVQRWWRRSNQNDEHAA